MLCTALLFLSLSARAEPSAAAPTEASSPDRDLPTAAGTLGIVGGAPVAEGELEAVVALFTRNANFGCTGTLIAPDLVLTAGHCGFSMEGALVGTHDLAEGGDWYALEEVWVHPDYATTYDVAVYRLSEPVTGIEPVPLLLDCDARAALVEGATVQIAGFGDIDSFATESTDLLHAADATVRDPFCADPVNSCNPAVSPGGELIAGGDGTDTCNGDSGGPLFTTVDGTLFLAGVTSRQALPSTVPCGDGGIYPRSDAFAAWIEETTGLAMDWPDCPDEPEINVPPVARADGITVLQNGAVGSTVVEIIDDAEQTHTLTLLDQPPAGRAWLEGDRVFVQPDTFSDEDYVLTVEVTDDGEPAESVVVELPVEVLGVTVIDPGSRGCETARIPFSWWPSRRPVTRPREAPTPPPSR